MSAEPDHSVLTVPPFKIEGFRLIEQIGRGGMGTVYKAEQEVLNRTVAIKHLHLRTDDHPGLMDQFLREGRNIARMEPHKNIVQVHTIVMNEAGDPCIVMEYVEGESLADIIRREKRLPLEDSLGIVADIAEALDHAHEFNVIHRDIKPGNIKVTRKGTVKILDFGLALHKGTYFGQKTSRFATPQYMSPEMVTGNKEIDGRSDIYSLGVLMFMMVTGELPFKETNPAKLAMHHLNTPPPRPSRVFPNTPPDVDYIVLKCLIKGPEERYQSARELEKDVRELLYRTKNGVPPPENFFDSKPEKKWVEADIQATELNTDAFHPTTAAVTTDSFEPQKETLPFEPVAPSIPEHNAGLDSDTFLNVPTPGSRIGLIGLVASIVVLILVLQGLGVLRFGASSGTQVAVNSDAPNSAVASVPIPAEAAPANREENQASFSGASPAVAISSPEAMLQGATTTEGDQKAEPASAGDSAVATDAQKPTNELAWPAASAAPADSELPSSEPADSVAQSSPDTNEDTPGGKKVFGLKPLSLQYFNSSLLGKKVSFEARITRIDKPTRPRGPHKLWVNDGCVLDVPVVVWPSVWKTFTQGHEPQSGQTVQGLGEVRQWGNETRIQINSAEAFKVVSLADKSKKADKSKAAPWE